MKLALFLAVFLPLAMSSPQKKALNPFLNSTLNIFKVNELKLLVTDLVKQLGSDEREAECETECNTLFNTQFSTGSIDSISHSACPVACHSLQELVHYFKIPVPSTTSSPVL
ncbi:uncharacterized protein LOC132546608 [Ylistrum balloti]|uniref:uncharacterized protein LOC132546608 n=1 Tax=Ylistrum balloti TaxID=509963 RepID=UPI002905D4F4|nr:uncharacterized protein LOC132546608 [Ylistrum balloti]